MADDAVAAPNPVIIGEVLSPGTASTETGGKLADYFRDPWRASGGAGIAPVTGTRRTDTDRRGRWLTSCHDRPSPVMTRS
jgi:hypothetical protein